ncbi:hypothetical protein B0H19DRAFT_1224590 [Mycena capillaripes]|nr:hypothetical protein B0H19DRAFT_1224590 [Mycena capillaripes]
MPSPELVSRDRTESCAKEEGDEEGGGGTPGKREEDLSVRLTTSQAPTSCYVRESSVHWMRNIEKERVNEFTQPRMTVEHSNSKSGLLHGNPGPWSGKRRPRSPDHKSPEPLTISRLVSLCHQSEGRLVIPRDGISTVKFVVLGAAAQAACMTLAGFRRGTKQIWLQGVRVPDRTPMLLKLSCLLFSTLSGPMVCPNGLEPSRPVVWGMGNAKFHSAHLCCSSRRTSASYSLARGLGISYVGVALIIDRMMNIGIFACRVDSADGTYDVEMSVKELEAPEALGSSRGGNTYSVALALSEHKPSHAASPSHPRLPSQIQTPLSGASHLAKPLGQKIGSTKATKGPPNDNQLCALSSTIVPNSAIEQRATQIVRTLTVALTRPREAPPKVCPKNWVFELEKWPFACPDIGFLRPRFAKPLSGF